MSELHSSIQPDPKVSEYYSQNCKYYFMPLYKETMYSDLMAWSLGNSNPHDRTLDEIKSSFIKAASGHYSHVKIPFDRPEIESFATIEKLAEEHKLEIVLQVCTSFLYDDRFFHALKSVSSKHCIEWVLDSCHYKVEPRILELSHSFSDCHLSVVVHKEVDWTEILKDSLLKRFQSVHLYFPYQNGGRKEFLNSKEVYEVFKKLKRHHSGIDFFPPKGVDLWDHRARHDFDMEPFYLPCFETHSLSPKVRFSVVIPSFNNQKYILTVLNHLHKQDVGLDSFEVVLVDDGSSDETQKRVLSTVSSFKEPMNFKYIFFPRTRERVMGDSQYRAGISRNLGVKNSVGEFLCFLDSDIVVPPSYLSQVEVALNQWDAVQAKRINLSRQASLFEVDYSSIDRSKDLMPDEKYWEEFLECKDWDKLAFNWKYVCTHSFSLRRDLFWQLGAFKRNFIYYGFEDTDFGYRLVKAGKKLHLLNVDVFHLFHENGRSEFMNLSSLRHKLLCRTAQIFYLHHLDDQIFQNLVRFMATEQSLDRFFTTVIDTLTLKGVRGKGETVFRSFQKSRPSL